MNRVHWVFRGEILTNGFHAGDSMHKAASGEALRDGAVLESLGRSGLLAVIGNVLSTVLADKDKREAESAKPAKSLGEWASQGDKLGACTSGNHASGHLAAHASAAASSSIAELDLQFGAQPAGYARRLRATLVALQGIRQEKADPWLRASWQI